MTSLAVLIGGYLLSILVGRLRIRSQSLKYALCALIAAVQVTVVLLQLFHREIPNLEKP